MEGVLVEYNILTEKPFYHRAVNYVQITKGIYFIDNKRKDLDISGTSTDKSELEANQKWNIEA